VDKIRDRVTPEQRARIARNPTDNLTASDLHTRATRMLYEYETPEEIQAAIELFQQAVALDSGYAGAYAGLSRGYRIRATASGAEGLDSAVYFARRAIRVDSSVSDGYTALGRAYAAAGRLRDARVQLDHALSLNRNDLQAAYEGSLVKERLRLYDEALRAAKLASDLDRTSAVLCANVARMYMNLEDLGKAEQWARTGLRFDPDDGSSNVIMALVEIAQGRDSAAVPYIRALVAAAPTEPWSLRQAGYLSLSIGQDRRAIEYYERAHSAGQLPPLEHAYAYVRVGDRRKADAIFAAQETQLTAAARDPERAADAYLELAQLYAARGDRANALRHLEIAYDRGARELQNLLINPIFESVRADPHFQKVVSKIHTDVRRMRLNAEEKRW
jgi:tetratricopeptide (TPR) repeat protein